MYEELFSASLDLYGSISKCELHREKNITAQYSTECFVVNHQQDEELHCLPVIRAHCQLERVGEAGDSAVPHQMSVQGSEGEGSLQPLSGELETLQQVGGDEIPSSSRVYQSWNSEEPITST